MHVVTHLSEKYEKTRTPENGWSISEAGMAQLDDIVGSVMKYLRDNGLENNTILAFSTDNGAENFTWPDGGQTPFAGAKGTVMEGGFRAPMIIRWPGRTLSGKVDNGLVSGLDWFPTFVAAAGNPNIVEELKQGKQIGGRTYKIHLDGYDQNGSDKRQRTLEAPRDFFSLPKRRSARSASMTSNTGSLISRMVGLVAL
jgi:arylsulfatase A-like enzyme